MYLAAQNARLYGCAYSYALVRVNALIGLLARLLLNGLLHSGYTSGAAHQDYTVYLIHRKIGIL